MTSAYLPDGSSVAAEAGGELLAWLSGPDSRRGVRVLTDGRWEHTDYAELAQRVDDVAADLTGEASEDAGPVGVVDEGPVRVAAGLLGALRAGRSATVLPAPVRGAVAAETRARALGIRQVVSADGVRLRGGAADAHEARNAPRREEPAIVQFTSGTTGEPRPIRLTRSMIGGNVAAIRAWLGWGPADHVALWLPLHHDMGLISVLLAVGAQSDVWYLTPRDFLAEPVRWLECFGLHGATVTAAPTFGYRHAAARLQPQDLAGLDLSGWRHAIIGAEPVSASTLEAFSALAGHRGFPSTGFRPAYGMAEATLAVTGAPAGAPPRLIDGLGGNGLGARMRVVGDRALGERALGDERGVTFVSCGRPLPGVHVGVVDERGEEVPEGVVGEIVIAGPSVTAGERVVSASRRPELPWRTGDAGLVVDGELLVLGRIAGSLSAKGLQMPCEPLEQAIVEALDGTSRECVVVPAAHPDLTAILVFGPQDDLDERRALTTARRHLGRTAQVAIVRRRIPRTTSGKPRRRQLWHDLAEMGPA